MKTAKGGIYWLLYLTKKMWEWDIDDSTIMWFYGANALWEWTSINDYSPDTFNRVLSIHNVCERPIIIDKGPFVECAAQKITLLITLLVLLAKMNTQTALLRSAEMKTNGYDMHTKKILRATSLQVSHGLLITSFKVFLMIFKVNKNSF